MIEEIKKEIDEQIENIKYLQDHPKIREHSIMHETDEYCRGALAMLDYLKQYIEYHT